MEAITQFPLRVIVRWMVQCVGVLNLSLAVFVQISYRVTRDIAPGEELLLYMKSEERSCETMAPEIHG